MRAYPGEKSLNAAEYDTWTSCSNSMKSYISGPYIVERDLGGAELVERDLGGAELEEEELEEEDEEEEEDSGRECDSISNSCSSVSLAAPG
jgi:hypothetical protein